MSQPRPPSGIADKAKQALASGLGGVRGGLAQGQHRLRHLIAVRSRPPAVSRRPDGTPVAPSPASIQSKSATGAIIERIVAPVRAVETAVRDRWDDAVREARLAAKEKETDMRADYERRVHHDARLHAEQHNPRERGS